MKMFIWKQVENVTGSYHSGGGLAVVAESLEKARALIQELCPGPKFDGLKICEALTAAHDFEYNVDKKSTEIVHIFPNEGCC